MTNIALCIALAVCAFGWLNRYVCNIALIHYMHTKKYTPPSDAEMEACLTEAWLQTLHLK